MGKRPYFITFEQIGEPSIGYISVAQSSEKVPFEIKRTYWVYGNPESVERGNHAHIQGEQVLVCLSGEVLIQLEDKDGKVEKYQLNNPNEGLFVPGMFWRTIKMNHTSVLMCLASTFFTEEDYIRDYHQFKSFNK